MLRIIVKVSDCGAAANVGGPVNIDLKTFAVDLPEVEAFLKKNRATYVHAEVIGVEVVDQGQR